MDSGRFGCHFVLSAARLDATRVIVPLGCLYTPLKVEPAKDRSRSKFVWNLAEETEGLQLVEYEPVICKATQCCGRFYAALYPLQ